MSSTGRTATAVGPAIDNTTGRVTFGAFTFGAQAGASGAGDLASIRFRAQGVGQARLNFGDILLSDPVGAALPGGGQAGADVIVTGRVYLPLVLRPLPNGTISGRVVNATTGQPIAAAQLCVLGTSLCTNSNGEGNYTLVNVPGGNRTVRATASGYTTLEQAVTVPTGGSVTLNFALSPVLAQGEMRIVLTWGENPRDLDSHLWLPSATPYHVYFSDKGRCEAFPHACLDTDDTTSYGPETVTIRQRYNGTYTYAVYLYYGEGALTTSGARVQVYGTNGLIATYSVPTAGTGRWWYVFDLDGATGALTPRNTIGDSPPRAYLGASAEGTRQK